MHAHVDPLSGVAGDMLLGAVLDAGAPVDALRDALGSLGLPPFALRGEAGVRCGLAGTRAELRIGGEDPSGAWLADHAPHEHGHHLGPLLDRIAGSTLPETVRAQARDVFLRLGQAEADAHGVSIDAVHLHEVGAADAVLDVCGVLLGLHLLGVTSLSSGPIPLGSGTVRCAHGVMPVPVPAVTRLLLGLPTVPGAGAHPTGELSTPTGVALLCTLAERFGPPPPMVLSAIGVGLGSRERDGVPNVTRLLLGARTDAPEAQQVEVLTTTLDDLDGRVLPHLLRRLLAQGALDVTATPTHGKKGRPALILQALAPSAAVRDALAAVLFDESPTLGLRWHQEQRLTLPRRTVPVSTPWGPVRLKLAEHGGVTRAQPELEDALALAEAHGVPLQDVLAAARRADLE